MFWHVPSRVLHVGRYAPDSLETSDPRTHMLSFRSYSAVEYKSQNFEYTLQDIEHTSQDNRIYIAEFSNIHYKIISFTSQGTEHTSQD